MKNLIVPSLLITVFTGLFPAFGQEDLSFSQLNDKRAYYNWFDDQVGIENTALFNGIRYKELYRVNGDLHKFYKSPDFLIGDVIYQGQPYFDQQLKYDLYEDQIIVQLTSQSGSSIMKLIKDQIDAFQIEGKQFYHLRDLEVYKSKEIIDDFYELMHEGKALRLFKKNKKIQNKVLEKKVVYYQFRAKDEYYLLYEDVFYPVKSKSDFLKIFPNNKKQINDYFASNKYLMKTDYDAFMLQAAVKVDAALISNKAAL